MSYPTMIENRSIRVALVDDQLLFRAGIRTLIDRGNGITVVGDAGSRGDALALVQSQQPDVILAELELRGESGLEYIPDLIAAAEKAKVLILTDTKDPDLHRKAVHLGAKGLLFKDSSVEVLTKAIEKVYAGEVWLDRSTTAALLDELSRKNDAKKLNPEEKNIATLTDREREVISLVGEGLKNKQIGERLFISDVTVRHHLTSIFSKLGVSDRLELVIYAYRHGLVPIPR
jgi:two-component system, NarL family, nitrate/nitrite response regulator NarL